MTDIVRFTNNYSDHSTEAGYQFEFYCMRCGNGYKSGFNASALGIGNKVVRGLGGLLGGRLGGASYAGHELKDLTESQAKDKALRKAVEEVSPLFNQCHRCGSWVCKDICWNDEAQLCVNCAPKLEQEIAGMQQQRRLQQVSEKINESDYASDVNVERMQVALCPHCGAEAQHGAKFCGECGQTLAVQVQCGRCGTTAAPGTKFCPECGNGL
ncbi:MAG TPA: zinc ribbon domain-containing protein [Actinomycetota bacterium]|nr:zinc ribbon domain-containing protein [Actinomycetota bacterium]